MSEEQARYPKLGKILNLIIKMQSRLSGITLNDIQQELEVSRRSAERLRDVLIWEVPSIVEIDTLGREKHWGFSKQSHLREIITFGENEIAELEAIKAAIVQENKKKVLESIITKLKALSKNDSIKIEDAIEILLKTEGYAVTQGPSYKIDIKIFEVIRQAIKECLKIKCLYNGKKKLLSPCGIIYGENVFLIARENEYKKLYVYRLHRVKDIKLTNIKFDKGNFDIKEYASHSFGVYQNEILKVELLFSKNVAPDASNYNFHPSQKIKANKDGTVSVKFKASGELQILRHLFRWGSDVKIISPKSLKKQYVELLESVIEAQK